MLAAWVGVSVRENRLARGFDHATTAQPLPVGPLSEEKFEDVMRCWQPAPRR
jgi:hypothetical protein